MLTEGGGRVEVIDPLGWTHTSLTLEPGTILNGVVISPDSAHMAFHGVVSVGESDKGIFMIADLQTGATQPIPINTPSPTDAWQNPDPATWNCDVLFMHAYYSATSLFWRIDLAHPRQRQRSLRQ